MRCSSVQIGRFGKLAKANATTHLRNAVTVEFLEAFADAWNRHDLAALMTAMTDDPVFESSSGPDVDGMRYEGWDQVREGFAAVFSAFPDARWDNARHVVCGNRGLSEWTFSGTRGGGVRVEVHGCDVFTFEDGKIAVKDSYRKNRT